MSRYRGSLRIREEVVGKEFVYTGFLKDRSGDSEYIGFIQWNDRSERFNLIADYYTLHKTLSAAKAAARREYGSGIKWEKKLITEETNSS